jgi:hypothetical protein
LQPSREVYLIERIIAAVTYLTAGLGGFVWLIIAAFAKKRVTQFLLYHILQSIFISIAYFLFIELYKLLFIVLAKIPLINTLTFIIDNILNGPLAIFMGLSVLQVFTTGVILYLTATSFMGQYSYLPFISNIIDQNSGRK